MSVRLLSLLIAGFLGVAALARGDDAKKDQEKLQGTWEATEAVGNGKSLPQAQLKRVKVVFSGEKMSFYPPDGDGTKALELTFKVDPSKKPKSIDTSRLEGSLKGQIVAGIHEVAGDTLKLCLPVRPGKDRPTEFAAPEKSALMLLTLKRAKQ